MPKDHPMMGDVFFLDLTSHTLPSKLTMKESHRVIVIQRNFRKPPRRVIVVPCESFRPDKHWDARNERLKYPMDYLLSPSEYSELKHDTIADCSQIFTIDSSFLKDYRFTLNERDIVEIQKRMAYMIGF